MRDILYTMLVLFLCWSAAHGEADEAVQIRARLPRSVGLETCLPAQCGKWVTTFVRTIDELSAKVRRIAARLLGN